MANIDNVFSTTTTTTTKTFPVCRFVRYLAFERIFVGWKLIILSSGRFARTSPGVFFVLTLSRYWVDTFDSRGGLICGGDTTDSFGKFTFSIEISFWFYWFSLQAECVQWMCVWRYHQMFSGFLFFYCIQSFCEKSNNWRCLSENKLYVLKPFVDPVS